MSIFIDTLATLIRETVEDAGATQEDWGAALAQVFEEAS